MSYTVELTQAAERDLAKLPSDLRRRVLAALTRLEADPRPSGALPIKSAPPGHFRLRVQDLRVGYDG